TPRATQKRAPTRRIASSPAPPSSSDRFDDAGSGASPARAAIPGPPAAIAPHCWQNRAPAAIGRPQLAHGREARTAPPAPQNLPAPASAPQEGQVIRGRGSRVEGRGPKVTSRESRVAGTSPLTSHVSRLTSHFSLLTGWNLPPPQSRPPRFAFPHKETFPRGS